MKLIIQEGETLTEIEYTNLTDAEIKSRIRRYEKKYGESFEAYSKTFSCSEAHIHELQKYLDWEHLIQEQERRSKQKPSSRKSRPMYPSSDK